jgi:hypothetical protein
MAVDMATVKVRVKSRASSSASARFRVWFGDIFRAMSRSMSWENVMVRARGISLVRFLVRVLVMFKVRVALV